jgi:hypothetical protein
MGHLPRAEGIIARVRTRPNADAMTGLPFNWPGLNATKSTRGEY